MSVSVVPITKIQDCQSQKFDVDLSKIYQDTQTIYTLALNNLNCSGQTTINYITWILELQLILTDGSVVYSDYGPSDEYNPNYSPVFPKNELYAFLNDAIDYWKIFLEKYSIRVDYNSESLYLIFYLEGCDYINIKPSINLNPTLSYICN